MKETYEPVQIEIIVFEMEDDIITSSCTGDLGNGGNTDD